MNKKIFIFIMGFFVLSTSFSGCIEYYNELEFAEYKAKVETLDNLSSNGDYEEIINVTNEYLQDHGLNNNNFKIIIYRAISYSMLEQEDLAIKDYETAVSFIYGLDAADQKEFSYIFFMLGYLYVNQGNMEKTREYYSYGLKIDPSFNQSNNEYMTTKAILYNLDDIEDYEGMVSVVAEYFQDNELNQSNFEILYYSALSYTLLEQEDLAIQDYEAMVPFIHNLDNVEQRSFSILFFSLGSLYAKQGNGTKALEHYNYGLQLDPHTNYYQIQLGQIYEELGRGNEALQHYLHLQESLPLSTEEEAILNMKIERLSGQDIELDFEIPESYYPYFTINIIPINDFNSSINLHDICVLIKSKFRINCQVISPMQIPKSEILDMGRNQYDAEKIINYLNNSLNESMKQYSIPIVITDYDIFFGNANYILSLQGYDAGIGVISTYMFEKALPEINESEIILGRRLGIQFISTVGQLLGSQRPTNTECPLAYVHSILEFSRKSSKLCPETQNDVDERIQNVEELLILFTDQEKEEITKVYEKYYFE